MTATFQTSFFSSLSNSSVNEISERPSTRLYQVEVEDFDHEVVSMEIEATSVFDAAEKAESRFNGDVYNMNIYELQY